MEEGACDGWDAEPQQPELEERLEEYYAATR
jgi:hypothetical protein